MGRVLLLIVGFVVALGLAGALTPNGHAQPEKAQPTQERPKAEPPSPPNEGRSGNQLNADCRPGEDNRQSDLCAQWKAADSAASAAIWTKYGVLVGLATMLAATVAAAYARLAANHTRDGAKAAWAAEKVTRESAERQLRAYLTMERFGSNGVKVGEKILVFIEARNSGGTPAFGVVHRVAIDMVADPHAHEYGPITDIGNGSVTVVGANAPYLFSIDTKRELTLEHIRMLREGWAIVVWGYVQYIDTFSVPRRTEFRYWSRPLVGTEQEFTTHPGGNLAT